MTQRKSHVGSKDLTKELCRIDNEVWKNPKKKAQLTFIARLLGFEVKNNTITKGKK